MKPQTLPPLRLGIYRSRLLSIYLPAIHLVVATVLLLAMWHSWLLWLAFALVLLSLILGWKRHVEPYRFHTEVPLIVDSKNDWRLGAPFETVQPMKLLKYNRGRYGVILTFVKQDNTKLGLVLPNDSFSGDDLRKLHVRLRQFYNSQIGSSWW